MNQINSKNYDIIFKQIDNIIYIQILDKNGLQVFKRKLTMIDNRVSVEEQ